MCVGVLNRHDAGEAGPVFEVLIGAEETTPMLLVLFGGDAFTMVMIMIVIVMLLIMLLMMGLFRLFIHEGFESLDRIAQQTFPSRP